MIKNVLERNSFFVIENINNNINLIIPMILSSNTRHIENVCFTIRLLLLYRMTYLEHAISRNSRALGFYYYFFFFRNLLRWRIGFRENRLVRCRRIKNVIPQIYCHVCFVPVPVRIFRVRSQRSEETTHYMKTRCARCTASAEMSDTFDVYIIFHPVPVQPSAHAVCVCA